jgi:hypothetical protein
MARPTSRRFSVDGLKRRRLDHALGAATDGKLAAAPRGRRRFPTIAARS